MASNKIPTSYDSVVALLHNAVAGARDHGKAVGLKQNDEATLRPLLDALAGTEYQPGAKGVWNTAKSHKVAATAALREMESRGRALVMAIVGVLKLRLGTQWNAQWHEAGFSHGSLHIPDHPHALLLQLRSLLLAHPDYEVPNLTDRFDCTAAACQNLANAIDVAKTASQASNAEAGAAKQHLDQAIAAARARLTGLRQELTLLLGPDDARWYAFGFDRPNDSQIPAIPAHVSATVGTAGHDSLFVEWDDARRADNYRAVLIDVATGQSVAERLVYDSEAVFTGLPTGTHLKIAITSRNEAGESQPSEPVTVQLP